MSSGRLGPWGQGSQHAAEVEPGEPPFERLGDHAVSLAEGEEGGLERSERAPLVGLEDLALDDAEVELDLVQPGGVDRGVDDSLRRSLRVKRHSNGRATLV